jgi:predicted RNA binding protein YcfA (HicA-like mRNA interferase family)
MKVRDAIKLIEKEGWTIKRTRGDHRVYVHPIRPGIVVVLGHGIALIGLIPIGVGLAYLFTWRSERRA